MGVTPWRPWLSCIRQSGERPLLIIGLTGLSGTNSHSEDVLLVSVQSRCVFYAVWSVDSMPGRPGVGPPSSKGQR